YPLQCSDSKGGRRSRRSNRYLELYLCGYRHSRPGDDRYKPLLYGAPYVRKFCCATQPRPSDDVATRPPSAARTARRLLHIPDRGLFVECKSGGLGRRRRKWSLEWNDWISV